MSILNGDFITQIAKSGGISNNPGEVRYINWIDSDKILLAKEIPTYNKVGIKNPLPD